MQKIALLGYPNSGKTSIFNMLTKQKRKTANFVGVTVDTFSTNISVNDIDYQITDLPGINSLAQFANSKDEIVVGEYVRNNEDSIYLNVVNINQLKRHLLLTVNAINKNLNVILVVNMVDTIHHSEKEMNEIQDIINKELKIPVIISSAHKKIGRKEILSAIANFKTSEKITVNTAVSDPINISNTVDSICRKIGKLTSKSTKNSQRLDSFMIHPILGLPIFFLSIYLLLFITMNIHALFSGLFDSLGGIFFIDLPGFILEKINAPEIISLVIAEGIGSGIQTILSFVPIIFTLFFVLHLMEQTGYIARQAFIADATMKKIGLPGKAFVSLIMGFGCTAACATGCRTLERESDRKLALMLSPSVSCGAKLAVYIYLGYIFFDKNATNVIFLMYVLGILFVVINGLFLSRSLFPGDPLPFIIELPDYRKPSLTECFQKAYVKVKAFLFGIGKTIVPIVAFLTIVNSIDFKGNINPEDKETTVLAVTSKQITPVLNPIGINNDNWQATLAIITGLFAKEILVATLDYLYFAEVEEETASSIIENIKITFSDFFSGFVSRNYLDLFEAEGAIEELQSDNLNYKRNILLEAFGSYASVFSFLIFILMYTPCVAAMGAITKEIGRKWALMVGLWSLFNAYMFSLLYYQFATLGIELRTSIILLGFIVCYGLIFIIFKYYGDKYQEIWKHKFIFAKKTK